MAAVSKTAAIFFCPLTRVGLALFNFGPGIPQGHGAIEDGFAGGGIHAVHAEIAQPLELEPLAGFGSGQAGFKAAGDNL